MTFPLTDNSALGTPRGHSEKRGTDGHNRRASALGNLFIPTEGFSPSGGICGCVRCAARARSRGPHLRAAFARNGVEEGGTIVAQGGSPGSKFHNETEPRRGDTGSEMSPAEAGSGFIKSAYPAFRAQPPQRAQHRCSLGTPVRRSMLGYLVSVPQSGTGALARQAFTPHPRMHRRRPAPRARKMIAHRFNGG